MIDNHSSTPENHALEACRALLRHHENTYDGASLDIDYAHGLQLAARAVAAADGADSPYWDPNLAHAYMAQTR